MSVNSNDFPDLPSSIRWLDRQAWLRSRRQQTRRSLRSLAPQLRALDEASRQPRAHGDVHLVCIPHDGPATGSWGPARGNLFFEVYTSAVELLGEERVTLAEIPNGMSDEAWHAYVLDLVAATRASHVIGQIERNPNKTNDWSWDVLASALGSHWGGTFVGQMYDAGFEWLRLRAQRLGSLMENLLVADLCEPMDGYVKRGQPGVGPMTMPLSYETVRAVDVHVENLPKAYDVSFIGALYDYRIAILERLQASGFDVKVNPHRSDATATYEQSRTNQPSWLDYMAGLAQSELTLNFARASSGPRWQYKIRVQEAALVGCICLTDDVDRTSRFFAPDQYAYFDSENSLEGVVKERLSDREALHTAQARTRDRAHELAVVDYWGRIDDGLRRRGLPVITGLSAPAAPSG